MSHVFLFCTAKEAMNLIREALAPGTENADEGIFYLVETRDGVEDDDEFKKRLEDGEHFQSDFIGADEQTCQAWSVEKTAQYGSAERDIIGIADGRSGVDGTLLLQFYTRLEPDPELNGEDSWIPEANKWHSFRVHHTKFHPVYTALCYIGSDIAWPVYFGHTTEFTDEHGVLDVDAAEEAVADGRYYV